MGRGLKYVHSVILSKKHYASVLCSSVLMSKKYPCVSHLCLFCHSVKKKCHAWEGYGQKDIMISMIEIYFVEFHCVRYLFLCSFVSN